MYVMTDDQGRITATTSEERFAQGMEPYDFPANFDFFRQHEYRIEGGELIHDQEPISAEDQIAEAQSRLAATDYVPVKLAEYAATGREVPAEDMERYRAIIAEREELRAKINALRG